MNILLLGGGGREHAFAWKMSASPLCKQLFIAPGNAGTAQHGTNVPISVNDFPAIEALCLEQKIDMIMVGPEEPLVRGLVDYFKAKPSLAHILLVGPSAQGALLEGSKAFAKEFMSEFGIPTAAYREFNSSQLDEALAYLDTQSAPVVLKADGLAAGKGVVIPDNIPEAKTELSEMLQGRFGASSEKVVIEQFLKGIEFSVFVATDGKAWTLLPVAKDYKRIFENDLGPNTGGMGAVSPVPFADETVMQKVISRIIEPTMTGIQARGIDYKGFIFVGLILVDGEPFVIEYNCRMGDPETEVVLPRIQSDLVALLQAIAKGELAQYGMQIDPRFVTTIMLVSAGYPGEYSKGKVMSRLDATRGSLLFHAGTKLDAQGRVITDGGRVMAVSSYGSNMYEALAMSNKNAGTVDFEGKFYRRDIGFDL
jgi:phosphoribosylamine--glycine ligase